ncbi:hypothetical protein LX36DRAFT_239170 [Colletotrichum falcatum]|nr:hypothetical protein LX36DRAFT_239170 [Colletotrichum falcatum]
MNTAFCLSTYLPIHISPSSPHGLSWVDDGHRLRFVRQTFFTNLLSLLLLSRNHPTISARWPITPHIKSGMTAASTDSPATNSVPLPRLLETLFFTLSDPPAPCLRPTLPTVRQVYCISMRWSSPSGSAPPSEANSLLPTVLYTWPLDES